MDVRAEKAALLRRDEDWSAAAFEGRDVELILSFWADDAVVMPPGRASIVGKDAIRRFVEGSFQTSGFSIRWTTSDAVISADGAMAYLMSRNVATHAESDGTIVSHEGRAVTVWRKDAEGEWRCAVDIWNADASF